jgi:pimeloyl-ACP methyl ester carboxylesterase
MTATTTATDAVASRDGTSIAVYRSGSGPVLVLVDCALSEHSDTAKLAAELAADFTVVGYDRRGRGASGTGAIDLGHEIDDVSAVVAWAGGSALLFGHSSGAALALEAASRLGPTAVTGLYLWEIPYIVDGERAPVSDDLPARIAAAVASGRRGRAVALFFREAMGIPAIGVVTMRLLPSWRRAKRLAPTLAGDFDALEGMQRGQPIPADRLTGITVPVHAVVGGRSEEFFHAAARALAAAIPSAEASAVPNGHHGTPIMAPAPLAADLRARLDS